MVKLIFRCLFLVLWCVNISTYAQGLSTEGKDFWVGYMTSWNPSNNVILELYISADDTTRGTVTMPQQSLFNAIEFEVFPNVTKKIIVSTNLAMASGSGQIENKGVHIETDKNVSVYAMNKRRYSADMTVVLPTYSLGNNYFVLSHWEDGNRNNNANSDSEFLIVGITDNTEIEITPTFTTLNGNPANIPFRVTLQKGQIYQLRAKGDLTGSQIVATNNSDCMNFSVFSGNMYTQVGECNVNNGHDHLYAQMYPTNTLGTEFIVVPLENRIGGDIIKFLATQDNTIVKANGQEYLLNSGEFKKILSASVLNVVSDKPIAIGQYSRTMSCDGTLGDPFLIPISPNEQMLKKITFNAPSVSSISKYSLTIVAARTEFESITLDGIPIADQFELVEQNNKYVYAKINVNGGNHTIRSNDNGFIAYVYGFGGNESFGYVTGASLGNLNIDLIINDMNTNSPTDSLCLGSEISFQPVADTIFTIFTYDFGDGSTLITNQDTAVYHTYDFPGDYLVSLKASTGGNDCSNGSEEISIKPISVVEPVTNIFGPRSICPNTTDVEYLIEESNPNSNEWFVNGGNFVSQSNTNAFVDWGETNRQSGLQLLATNRYGCISDTINYPVKINIQLDPEAPFGPDTLCSNDIINIPYNAYYTNVSTYQWQTDFGTISNGNGSNEIGIDWQSYGNGKLWFGQLSITDTLCDGTSDTLLVYIQRNPSENGNILTVKDTFLMGEQMMINLEVDTLYQFANWVFDDGMIYDTISVGQNITHTFQCEGLHKITVVAYDTGTVCSQTKAYIEKDIYIKPMVIEIINITASSTEQNALEINWSLKNAIHSTKKIFLYKRKLGEEFWQQIASLGADQRKYIDRNVEIHQQSYEYKLVSNIDCENIIDSPAQHSILLSIEKEDKLASLTWNNYEGWKNGVNQYEIWVSIDSSAYELFETSSDQQINYEDSNLGFDHCFRIIATEKDGNKSNSMSNTTCVEFIPKIHAYNIITPNSDKFNEYFIIENIERYPNSKLTLMDRSGKSIFESIGYKNNWNGKNSGKAASSGTYYYILELNEPRNEIKSIRGYFSILY